MARLNQAVALERGRRDRASVRLARFDQLLLNPARLVGQTRRYEKMAEDGVDLPSESVLPQVRVADHLSDLRVALVDLFDVVATKDRANCDARVNVTLEGETEPILTDVPVDYLLFLEKELAGLRKIILSLPTVDPAESWTWDASTRAWRTEEIETLKPAKVLKSMITAPPTVEHPAQVHVFSEDVPVGKWFTVKFSGALQAERVKQLGDRITLLLEAVKRAREEANSIEVNWIKVGDTVFDYLLAD